MLKVVAILLSLTVQAIAQRGSSSLPYYGGWVAQNNIPTPSTFILIPHAHLKEDNFSTILLCGTLQRIILVVVVVHPLNLKTQ